MLCLGKDLEADLEISSSVPAPDDLLYRTRLERTGALNRIPNKVTVAITGTTSH